MPANAPQTCGGSSEFLPFETLTIPRTLCSEDQCYRRRICYTFHFHQTSSLSVIVDGSERADQEEETYFTLEAKLLGLPAFPVLIGLQITTLNCNIESKINKWIWVLRMLFILSTEVSIIMWNVRDDFWFQTWVLLIKLDYYILYLD